MNRGRYSAEGEARGVRSVPVVLLVGGAHGRGKCQSPWSSSSMECMDADVELTSFAKDRTESSDVERSRVTDRTGDGGCESDARLLVGDPR